MVARQINEVNTPWTDIVDEHMDYIIYADGFPVTPGHLLFVPKSDTPYSISQCLSAAYYHANRMVEDGEIAAYNIGFNCGEPAGQTVMWPHIHLIPRRFGDMEDPRGGVRNVIPSKGNYLKDS